ncbi:MAG: DUF2242 domain-containing protein [Azonexus sp.]|nr:DUF2242 domain-containing protein [Azonexus sp.]MCK6411350.1 DUF2242 domain-containing protein [Azonexus sp.]
MKTTALLRPHQRPTLRLLAQLFPLLLLAACTTPGSKPPAAYKSESFDNEATPFLWHSTQGPEAACEKGRRALLGQGYELEKFSEKQGENAVKGVKFFMPKSNQQLQLRITLVCLPSSGGSTIYANALQSSHELRANTSSSGLSVAGVGSISLPWPSSESGTLVKVGEETVDDPAFYQRLFSLIENIPD